MLLDSLTSKLSLTFKPDNEYVFMKRTVPNISNTNITERHGNSTKIVETSMIFNNYMVANYMLENSYPYIYRCHNIDYEYREKLNYYDSILKNEKLKKYVIESRDLYPCAYYSTSNSGHDGLNLKVYSHITSPLRRFCDVLNNIAIDKFYFEKKRDDKDVYNFENILKDECININLRNKNADMFVKEYEKKLYLHHS